jgi:hypothetical protein
VCVQQRDADALTRTQRRPLSPPAALGLRRNASAAPLGDECVMMFGGASNDRTLDDCWLLTRNRRE